MNIEFSLSLPKIVRKNIMVKRFSIFFYSILHFSMKFPRLQPHFLLMTYMQPKKAAFYSHL